MKNFALSLRITTVLAAGLALAAWGIAGYGMVKLSTDEDALAAKFSSLASTATQHDIESRLHALTLSTETDRAALTSAIPADLTVIADAINATGKTAGAAVAITSATPTTFSVGGKNVQLPQNVHAITFVIQATGSFAAVVHEVRLLELLPIPSSVSDMDFEYVPNAKASAQWRLTVRLTALTTAAITQ